MVPVKLSPIFLLLLPRLVRLWRCGCSSPFHFAAAPHPARGVVFKAEIRGWQRYGRSPFVEKTDSVPVSRLRERLWPHHEARANFRDFGLIDAFAPLT
jgi:hypothetical protein